MINLDFPNQTPTILTTRNFGDGVFLVKGNILLGFDNPHRNLLSFNIQPIPHGSFCSLFIWPLNHSQFSISNPCKQFLLFSENGKISIHPNDFEISLFEFICVQVKYFVCGRSLSSPDDFIFLSFIFENEQTTHFSFPVNDPDFRFNPNTSILFESSGILDHINSDQINSQKQKIVFAINCVSTIKMISFDQNNVLKTFQFDVEKSLSKSLQNNAKNLDFYETSIIGKNEKEFSFVVFLGFIFYHDTKNRWFVAFQIINVPANGKAYRLIHQEYNTYEIRPQGDSMKNTIQQWKNEFEMACLSDSSNFTWKIRCLTNRNIPGVDADGIRLIKAPEMNLIIADENNGIIKF
ncbi:hypothetical protein TRFO_15764 [Tritrichomonas foetus]|uniref:Uncharacterized protein n=1 Tax=Tritrichomonas foetus TaxID=1144522 RepID=A0A1J4KSA8_9EUKA|nr:hypothetical protein TRFO_15764 [Tritrichomonas foetus]|eukprot:OHT13986.1 hypothetical protein TRFO_15764 [Tritrichomonas foetus]